jgi:hypothetical protein
MNAFELLHKAFSEKLIDQLDLIELVGVMQNIKPVARFIVDPAKNKKLTQLGHSLGLLTSNSEFYVHEKRMSNSGDIFVQHLKWPNQRSVKLIIYLATPQYHSKIKHLKDTENSHPSSQQVGLLLGYPQCCVREYSTIEHGMNWIIKLASTYVKHRPAYPACNRFLTVWTRTGMVPDYFPCSLYCEETNKMARLYMAALSDSGFDQLAQEILYMSCLPISVEQFELNGMMQLKIQQMRDNKVSRVKIIPVDKSSLNTHLETVARSTGIHWMQLLDQVSVYRK